jgi:hypothetical protein
MLRRRRNYSARVGIVAPCAKGAIILHMGTYCTVGAIIPPGRVPLCRRRNNPARAGYVAP